MTRTGIELFVSRTIGDHSTDLVSLFNGISTIIGYLMPKPFSKKNSNGTI